nr:hypothetical protein [Tanacetum cinerariifolium]
MEEDGIFISQDKYVAEILKKFNLLSVKTASTPIETKKPLFRMKKLLMWMFQVTSKTSHLQAVKRIFRYLKDQPKLGLCYPKESAFDLEAYSDSDYAEADLNRKSTTRGQTTTGKELSNPLMAGSLPKTKFPTKLTSAKVKTVNDEVRIQALVDGKRINIKESSIRRTLRLDDAEGTSCLTNIKIFEGSAKMGAKTTSWNEFSSTMASAIICLATNQEFNFSRYILLSLVKNIKAGVPFFIFPRFVQLIINHQLGDMAHHKEIFDTPSLTKKVFSNMKKVCTGFSKEVTILFDNMLVQDPEAVGILQAGPQSISITTKPSTSKLQKKHKPKRKHTQESEVPPTESPVEQNLPSSSNDPLTSGEDSQKLKKLMDLCTNLYNKFLEFESDVIDIKSTYQEMIDNLESWVERLKEENRLNPRHIMDVNKEKPADVEVLEVVKATKLMTEAVTTAGATKVQAKDKGKAILIEGHKPLKKQAQIELDKEVNKIFKVSETVVRQEKDVEVESSKREDATPLALNIPIIYYKIHIERNRPYFKIIRANGNHMLFISLSTMLKNFDREDLESLWKIMRDRFKKTKPRITQINYHLNRLERSIHIKGSTKTFAEAKCATKVNSQLISNVCTYALSTEKINHLECYYLYFIRLMGGKASHVAVECTLQSHPNMVPWSNERPLENTDLNAIIGA